MTKLTKKTKGEAVDATHAVGVEADGRRVILGAIERLGHAGCSVPSALDKVTVLVADLSLVNGFALGALIDMRERQDDLGAALAIMELEHAFDAVDRGATPPVLPSTAANTLVARYAWKSRQKGGDK